MAVVRGARSPSRACPHRRARRDLDDLLAAATAAVLAEITPDKHARRHGKAIAAGDRLRNGLVGPAARSGAGNSEIRNWICVGGALEHLDLRWVARATARRPARATGLCFAQRA